MDIPYGESPINAKRLKLTLNVKRPLTSSLCRGIADFTESAKNLWGNSMVVGHAAEAVETGDMCTIQLGGEEGNLPYISPCIKEPEDLGQLTDMVGTAVVHGQKMKFAIKDFNIQIDNPVNPYHHGIDYGPASKTITLTGFIT